METTDDRGQEPAVVTLRSRPVAINAFKWGDPRKPTVVLVHGWRDHGRSWDRLAKILSRDRHVLVPDLRGHGDSGWSVDRAYGSCEMVLDLHALLSEVVSGLVDIVAHSAGAEMALRYAGIFPERVRRLVAIEGFGRTPRMRAALESKSIQSRMRDWVEGHQALDRKADARSFLSIADACARFSEVHPTFPAELVEHLVRYGIRPLGDGGYAWKHDPALKVFPILELRADQMHALWEGIQCTVLHLRGSQTWASDPLRDGQAQYFRAAEYLEFEGAGHWVHHDRPADVAAAVQAFLHIA